MQRTAPSDALRAAVVLDGRPIRRIARQANVPPAVLSRFMRRLRSMNVRSFDSVAGAVGLSFVPHRAP